MVIAVTNGVYNTKVPVTLTTTIARLSLSLTLNQLANNNYLQESISDKVKLQEQVRADFLKKFKSRY